MKLWTDGCASQPQFLAGKDIFWEGKNTFGAAAYVTVRIVNLAIKMVFLKIFWKVKNIFFWGGGCSQVP